jgi:hypothetical protein
MVAPLESLVEIIYRHEISRLSSRKPSARWMPPGARHFLTTLPFVGRENGLSIVYRDLPTRILNPEKRASWAQRFAICTADASVVDHPTSCSFCSICNDALLDSRYRCYRSAKAM